MNPVPVTVPALTVTAPVPVDDRVTDCVVGVFTFTLPKAMLVELRLSVGTVEPSCNAKVAGAPKALADNVAVCVEVTEETVALKLVLVAPAATMTEAGTVTAALLLARLTGIPALAAAVFNVTLQLSVPALAMDPLLHVNALTFGIPVPCRLMTHEDPTQELLASVSWPVASPAAAGSNTTLSVAVCPGLRTIGKLAPETVKPVPVSVDELIVTGASPVEESVIDCTAVPLTATLPKARLVEFTVSVGTTAPRSSAKVSDVPAALAVKVAV